MHAENTASLHSLFQPGKLGNLRIKNRIVMLPIGTAYGTQFGAVTQKTIEHYAERAKGGAGLVTVGNISPAAPNVFNQLSLESDWLLMGHYELVEKVHAHGAKIVAQLNLAGRQKYPEGLRSEEEIVSSSPISGSFLGKKYPKPKALHKKEIKAILKKFSEAAARAKKVGYDFVELHCAHGYLINQFLSPFMNKRTDEYGGTLENRMRFLLELIALMKEDLGDDFPLGVRLSAEEFIEGGVTLGEGVLISKELEKAGICYISVSAGVFETFHTFVDGMREPEGWKEYIWETIKRAVDIPVIAGGGLRRPNFCARLLEQHKADYIGLARPLLADPRWPAKVKRGDTKGIRLCIFCNECLIGSSNRRQGGGARRCTINPNMGRDREFTELKKASPPKKVMIAGAGVAGMEAARVAALRGHDVTVFEKNDHLGGYTYLAGKIKSKRKLRWFYGYLRGQLKELDVRIETGVEVDYALIRSFKPEGIVIATGAVPAMPAIPGIKKETVLNGLAMLEKNLKIDNRDIAVIGGGITGCEIAEHLVDMGNRVSIIEARAGLALEMEPINRHSLLKKLGENRVRILLKKEAIEITDSGVAIRCPDTGEQHLIAAEYVIIAADATPNQQLMDELDEHGVEYYAAGDCIKPRNMMEAVYEGSLAGRRL
ncbi:MAG: FAD-dependent oxidoreductase [Firmicutes bacterium]|nr:FAD-dependent oxidoreductase [Bacillota bacterium]